MLQLKHDVEISPYFFFPVTMLKYLEIIEKELQKSRDWDYAVDIILIYIFLYMYFTF